MKQLKALADPVNLVLGMWLALSPWELGHSGETVPTANAVIVGVALVATALGAILVPRAWEERTELALGLWLVVSPWALGFSADGRAMRAAVATGRLSRCGLC